MALKRVRWLGNARAVMRAFPPNARREAGYQLYRVQAGHQPSDWKPMTRAGAGVLALERLIARRRLTQGRAAKLLGVSQPRVNDLVRGRFHRFSIDALVDMLARAGVRVRFTTERGARVA